MPKYAIIVTYNTDDYYWINDDWKDQVGEDFDENVVIIGDRDSGSIEEASWWKDAKEIIDDVDSYLNDPLDEYLDYMSGLCSEDKLRDIYEMYHRENLYTDDIDFIIKVVEIIYPFLSVEHDSIRGYHTGADVIYLADAIDISYLEDWYYGNIYVVDAFELDTEAMEEDEVDINDLSISDVRNYGESIGEDFAITQTEYFNEFYRLSDAEQLNKFASEFGLNPEDCTLVED